MNNGRNNGGIYYIYTAQSLTENLKEEVCAEIHLSELLPGSIYTTV